MSGAEDTLLSPAHRVAAGNAVAAPGAPPRRRLFRKYALLVIALVGTALLVNSGFDFWFSYRENKAALVRIQQEKAEAAARRIEEFIAEIERQIGWTTHAQWSAGPLDQRRQDYFRLLRQVSGITELSQLDEKGRERLTVSRLKMDVIDSDMDFSQNPAFIEAKAHRIWFSPVYFRKESEPYMTLAMARDGKVAGVTVAEINLKLIWDVITALKIGQSGYAYVVDEKGRLIAHPDISLVLRDTDLSKLPQVAEALAPVAAPSPEAGGDEHAARVAQSIGGRNVLTAHAAIAPVGWRVFVEVPLSEAFAPLYGAALRTAVLLAFGLIAATLVALVLARRMTGPIRAIEAGAERIGRGELDRRIEVHTGDELEALAEQFNRMGADLQKSYAELEQRVADRTAELSESLDQQTATAEVLQVINSSPGDLAPVFDAMLDNAVRLCGISFASLWTYDGERFHPVARHAIPDSYWEFLLDHPPGPETGFGRLARGELLVHIEDILANNDISRLRRASTDLGGVRTVLLVPLRKDDALLGVIAAYRQEVRAFTDKQIALLQNFAAQAVIAMENARLITETREALEQQTATAEVLQVINSSPGDLAPVFDAMLEKALHLCDAASGMMWSFDGERAHPRASRDVPTEYIDYLEREPPGAGPNTFFGRAILTRSFVTSADISAEEPYRKGVGLPVAAVELGGIRAVLMAPLVKDNTVLGVFSIFRKEVRPFSDKQIALLQNFAAQAVIAMENARLITETREALDQQTATAEVLQVINSSPGDLAPVFDAMLERAMRLCEATHGHFLTYDGEAFHPTAAHGEAGFEEYWRQAGPVRPSHPGHPLAQLVRGARLVHVADAREEDAYRDVPAYRRVIDLGGIRTSLTVPLRKEGALLGAVRVYRQEVRPFSEKQIALVENFAAQAVIAMENARLITETREALEQQTATAEVLQVINSSPGDLAPVFDAMLEKATRLCDAVFGSFMTYDGEHFRSAAVKNVPEAFAEFATRGRVISFDPETAPGRLLAGESFVHIIDGQADEAYRRGDPAQRALVDLGGARTWVTVALRKDDTLLGFITVYRQEVRPFTDRQIALLQNFAAQAVIAMENARLITETREALEQQTATAEVLGVINSSPGDLAPVFDAMLEKATRLCDAHSGFLWTYDGERFRAAATRGLPPRYEEFVREPRIPGPDTGIARLAAGESLVHFTDLAAMGAYEAGDPLQRASVDLGGFRTILVVPLRKDDAFLGGFTIERQEVRPFSDKQIALLRNFAAQAVIAIENARLLTEQREALDQQTATAEVLQVINASPGDLAPVFDAMLEKAMRLCGIALGTLQLNDAGKFRAVAVRGVADPLAELLREPIEPLPGTPPSRLLAGERVVQITDMAEFADRNRADPRGQAVAAHGLHTVLFVPLRKDTDLLGYIAGFRYEAQPFSEKEIALLENFAAQAVIAIENARLITETREALEQQTATAEVLQVINSSPGDLAPVFDAMLDKAMHLCQASFGQLNTYEGGRFHTVAMRGVPAPLTEFRKNNPPDYGPGTGPARALAGERVIHTVDLKEGEAYRAGEPNRRALVDLGGARTSLLVPLLKEETVLGTIMIYRQEVRAFSDKQIALLQNFAAQAVIAMENARLLGELRERTNDLARSVEELKVLGEVGQAVSSTLDLHSVLVTILNRSIALAYADAGVIFRYSRAERAFRFVEAVGWDETLVEQVRDLDVGETVTALGDAIANRAPFQIPDLQQRPSNPLRDSALAAGFRSALIVPLVGADRIMGATILQRRAVGEFPEATIRLMQALASQSVLAIQNARLFREIADKSEQLAQASQHKSQFLANMSHELRTPLNAILGYTELMADGIYGELAPRAAGVLERVQNNGKHLLALINDVLDLAKIEAGQLAMTLEDYAMPDVVQSVVSATEGMATTKGLKFTADIAPGLPTGRGDARRLSQVLLNLVGNAVKFTDVGEVAIGARAENGSFVLTVRDTGPGIAAADQGKIFEEFQQVDNSNTRKKGGTGLGLAISKRMVEMQGGTISVDSELGHGATFRVTLPVRVEEVAEELLGAAQ